MRLKPAAVLIGVLGFAAVLAGAALAQAPPAFGARPPQPGGLFGLILEQQAQFYRQLSAAMRQIRAGESSAFAALLGVSFLYGVFHAAGPGHGKAVISSYIVATDETVKRGMVLAALSALVQALTAIALVGFLAMLLGATARTMGQAVNWIEIIAYGLIVAVGLRLVWTKGSAFLAHAAAWRSGRPAGSADCGGDCTHLPAAERIARIGSWREALAIIVGVGLRPCTGAVLVMVFAVAQAIVPAGVAAVFAMAAGTALTVAAIAAIAAGAKSLAVRLAGARTGLASLALSAAEMAAALVVVLFGLALLLGYLTVERMAPF